MPYLKLGLFGASFDTGNRGVSALGTSFCHGIANLGAAFSVTVFNYGRTTIHDRIDTVGERVRISHTPCYQTRRIYRSYSHAQMQLAAAMGLTRIHPMLRRIGELDAVLDVSGGDSFSDIYGYRRFKCVTVPKQLTAQLGVPLILLPQTYGPFKTKRSLAAASKAIGTSAAAWARDHRSFEVLKEILGNRFDPSRHRCTVDMAFGLPTERPKDPKLLETLQQFTSGPGTVIGVNVSALLYNDPAGGMNQFGFRGKYQDIIHALLRKLLHNEDVRILFVSHVYAPTNPMGGDHSVANSLQAHLTADERRRIHVVPAHLSATELKWVIGQCDWFCGTRMHACISALSQGVPTSAIAYTDKTLGVFETAGVGDCVIDPRLADTTDVVSQLIDSYRRRQSAYSTLARELPRVQMQLDHFYQTLYGQLKCA